MNDNLPDEPRRSSLKQYHQDYDRKLATAFRTDCEEFLEKFEKLQTLKFSEFAKIWKEKHFTCVFAYVFTVIQVELFNCLYFQRTTICIVFEKLY